MPRLVGGARKRNVEPHLDDPVVRTQHAARDRDEPGMGGDIDEATDALGMNLDVETLRPAGQGAARHRPRLREQGLDVRQQGVRPGRREGALEADDTVPVKPAHDRGGVVIFGRVRHVIVLPVDRIIF